MRMIDADMLADGLKLHRQSTDQKHETDRQWAVGYNAGLERALYSISYAPTLTPPNEWVSVEDELPKLPDCDKCSMMVNTARKGNPKSFPMIYERAIVRGKRVERWKYYWDRIADEPPDYWMYLPKPPTKET